MEGLKNLEIVKKITPYNFSDKNDISRIKYIVIHYFGSLSTAAQVATYFANAYRGASAHYIVDSNPVVYQCVEDEDIAWHCGTSKNYYHDECRNSNSIGIEVRPYKLNPGSLSSSDNDWYHDDKTVDNLVELTRYLMDKYGIDVDHVLRHYDVTHKQCPRTFQGDSTNIYYGVSGNQKWYEFKSRLTRNVDDNPSEWAKKSCDKAKAAGVFSGDGGGNYNWQGTVTRETLAVILDRVGLLDK